MAFPYEAEGTGTDEELLALNRQMQARVLANGQEYRTEDGKYLKLPDLAELRAQESEIQARIAEAAGGIASNLIGFQRRP